MKIVNLTMHPSTPEQRKEGVFDIPSSYREYLDFQEIPSKEVLEIRAEILAITASSQGADAAMIGGAPFFMATLERELKARGIKPCYAFSVRESIETVQEDGSVAKRSVFRHRGFVWA